VGLYDEIRSSYDLGEHFTDVEMQTKCLACAMCRYWISPDGCLYEMTYRETHDFVELKEGDEGYNDEVALFNFQWIPTGKHGKVEPCYVTDYVEVYPAIWNGDWYEWPRLKLHFKNGVLRDYEDVTGR